MLRTVSTFLIILASTYLALCVLLFFFQRAFIYFPQPRAQVPGAATWQLPTDGAQLLVTERPHSGPHALIYFGGNAEDVSYSLPGLAAAFPDHAIYLLHYRGYGGSSGTPSEAALFADALALFDRVQAGHRHITVVGRSLGSGVAVHLASQRPVARLVLVTPYSSIQQLAEQRFPYFPMRWLLRDKFESWRYAGQVSAPTLLLAAERDEVIPLASTQALYERFPAGTARLEVIQGTDHNSISESPAYIPALRDLPRQR